MNAALLDEILAQSAIDIHFQPIVSLKKKAVLGIEALARPQGRSEGPPPSPLQLFAAAAEQGRTIELDRLCRRQAFTQYAGWSGPLEQRPLLFVNIETSILHGETVGSGALRSAVEEAGLQPGDVVIEVSEARTHDGPALQRFVDSHRELGFLIALDDLGTGDSNLPRLAALRPHVFKLDRSLVTGLEKDYFKQETVKSLVGLARRTGALVLAEGVETEAEVDCCLDLGAELLQGYFFGRPMPLSLHRAVSLLPAIISTAQRQRRRAVDRIQARRREAQRFRRVTEEAAALLSASDRTGFDVVLRRLASANPGLECLYILDRMGIQISATVEADPVSAKPSRLYAPAPHGADHSNKEYFYGLADAGLDRFTTEPYLSMASGKLCRTVSTLLRHRDGNNYILCLDIKVEKWEV